MDIVFFVGNHRNSEIELFTSSEDNMTKWTKL